MVLKLIHYDLDLFIILFVFTNLSKSNSLLLLLNSNTNSSMFIWWSNIEIIPFLFNRKPNHWPIHHLYLYQWQLCSINFHFDTFSLFSNQTQQNKNNTRIVLPCFFHFYSLYLHSYLSNLTILCFDPSRPFLRMGFMDTHSIFKPRRKVYTC